MGQDVPGAGLRGRAERRSGHGRGPGRAVELRPVRGDHREGRPPDAARGRLGARVHAHMIRPARRVRPGRPYRRLAFETVDYKSRRPATAAGTKEVSVPTVDAPTASPERSRDDTRRTATPGRRSP